MVVLEVVKQNWLHMSALGPWNMTSLCFQDGFGGKNDPRWMASHGFSKGLPRPGKNVGLIEG